MDSCADKSQLCAPKPRNGEQYDPSSSSVKIEPGDSIVVPEEQEINLWPVVLQTVQVVTAVVGIFFGVYAITKNINKITQCRIKKKRISRFPSPAR